MNRCVECEHCVIETDENTNAKARCKLKTPPKKGKIITWACTTYCTLEDAYLRRVSEYGEDRVRADLSKKKKRPAWCPLNSFVKTV